MSELKPGNDHVDQHHAIKDATQPTHQKVPIQKGDRATAPRGQPSRPSPPSSLRSSPRSSLESENAGNHHHDLRVTKSAHEEVSGHRIGRAASPQRKKPLRSCLSPSHGHRRKSNLSVQWDSDVMFNEHKMQSRQKKSITSENPSKSESDLEESSKNTTLSKPPVAIVSAKMDLLHSRQPSLDSFTTKGIHPSSLVHPEHSRGQAHHTDQQGATIKKDVPSTALPRKSKKTPPAVPDPPRNFRCPPPTPRPARLPTPDLPEIDASKFFVPKEKLPDLSRRRKVSKGNTVQKLDAKLEAARAHILETTMRGAK